jgi:hypothetical protein
MAGDEDFLLRFHAVVGHFRGVGDITFGLNLSTEDRKALIAFLKTL